VEKTQSLLPLPGIEPQVLVLSALIMKLEAPNPAIVIAVFLRHYSISREVAGSRRDEVNEFSDLPNSSGRTRPCFFYSASSRNEYQKQKNNNVCAE
jgi:hypothetical protein